MSMPALRFNEFSSDWEQKTLEDITKEKISYGIVQAGVHIDGGVPYIKSSNVGGVIDLAKLQCTSDDIHHKYRRSAVHPNDIVISLRGNIGQVSIVPAEIVEANLTQGTARISVDDSNNNKFVYFQMQTRNFLDRVNERSTKLPVTSEFTGLRGISRRSDGMMGYAAIGMRHCKPSDEVPK